MADKIKFGVGFDVDQSDLNRLKASLEGLSKMSVGDVMKINTSNLQDAKTQLDSIRRTSSAVQDALKKAFNQKLETVNIQTFNKELSKSGLTLEQVHRNLQLAGTQGVTAFRSLANQVTSTNTQLKQSHTLLDKIGETLGNTIKWNIASGAVNRLAGSIQEAYGYVKALDGSLNDIRIVTGKSADSMADFAKQANDAAKQLGTSTTNYTKSALTFYQQGLGDEEVKARAELSNKVSNVTGLSGDQAAEYVTAVLNGYKVGSEEAEHAMDKLAAVAASTASDLAELSEGMSKVASGANAMGVSEDQLAATLSTVISVTRQSASTVGTAFKTIYARIADIKAGAEDAEVSLGEYSGRMAEMGFNVLDSEGHLRDLGEVIEEIGGSWATLSREQQVALAKTMAGTRQYNNLIALFDNWGDYMDALNVSMEANGTLQQQQSIYMESTKAHLEQMSASMEDVYDSLLDPEAINTVASIIGGLANVTADWIDSIGGGTGVLETLGSVAVMVFSKQIANGINTTIQNFIVAKNNAQQLRQAMDAVSQFQGVPGLDNTSQQILNMKESMYQLAQVMSPESFSAVQESISAFTNASNQVTDYEGQLNKLRETVTGMGYDMNNLDQNFDQINAELSSNIEGYQQLQSQVEKVRTSLSNVKFGSNNTVAHDIEATSNAMDRLIQNASRMHDEGSINEAMWERMSGAIERYKAALEQAEAEGQDFSNNSGVQRAVEGLISIFGGQLTSTIQSTQQVMHQLYNEVNLDANSITNLLTAARAEAARTGVEVQTVLKNAARQEIIGNFTKMAGAISSVGFAIQNIQNLGNIWNNDDLTTGEKILQTATNLATTLPMLLSGYTALRGGIVGVTNAKKIYTTATAAMATAETAGAAATAGATAAQWSFNAAVLANPLTWVIVAIVGAAAAAYGLYRGAVKAAAEAEKERLATSVDNTIALEDEADAVNDAYIAYKNLYDTFTETGEGEDELRDAVLSLADAFGIQINTLDILAGRYDEINKKILETRASQAKAALDAAKEGKANAEKQLAVQGTKENSKDSSRRDIIFGAGAEWDSADAAVNDILYQHLDGLDYTNTGFLNPLGFSKNGIRGIAEDNIVEAYKRIQDAYEAMTNNLDATVLDNSEYYASIGKWLAENEQYFTKYEALETDMVARAQEFAEAQGALTADGMNIAEVDSYKEYEEYKKQYIEQLRAALGGDENIIYDEDLFDSTNEYLEYLASQYLGTIDKIKEYVETSDIAGAIKEAMLGNESANETDVNNFVDKLSGEDLRLIATIGIDEGATEEEVRKTLALARKQAEDSLGQATADAINTVMASYNSTKKLNKGQQEELDAAKAMLDTYLATTEGIYGMTTAMEEWEMVSQRGSLAQLEYLQDLTAHQNDYANQTEENLREELSLELELLQAKEARLAGEASAMDELGEKVLAYEALKKDPDFDATSDEAKAIFESVEAYEAATREVENYKAEIDEVEGSIKDIQDTLSSGDLTFEVDMTNVEEILSVGDTILSEAEKIKEAAELIGEGFTVAADDADKLAEIFPQLLENATVTSDGIIHLDQQTVQALLGGQQQILDGDVNTAVAKIDNQIAILQARKEAAESELEIANAVARGEVGIEEARTRILADGQQQLTNYLMQLGMEESQAQAATTAVMAGNLEEYNKLTAGVANDVANNLAGAMAAAANATQGNASGMVASLQSVLNAAHQAAMAMAGVGNGQVVGGISGGAAGGATGGSNFGASTSAGSFSGNSGSSASASSIDVSGWQDQLLGDIAGYDQAIADLTALKAKLLASQKNASSALGGASSGSGGKPDKNKGGGGGGKKDKDADQKDLIQDELDTYHDIDIRIKQITSDLEKLEREQDRLSGQDLIDNLNKQLEILQKQKEAYADKIELAKMEAGALKSALATYGATFDSKTGEITNYYDLIQSQLDKANAEIERYNALSAEQQTEDEKAKVEAAKKRYEQLKSLIDQYEKTINDVIPELEKQIEDALLQEIDIQIQKFDMKLQLHLDMSEAQRDWNEFKRKVIDDLDDDDLSGKATQGMEDILSYYQTKGTNSGSIQARTDRVNSILKELGTLDAGGHSSIYSAFDQTTGKWVDDRARAEADLKEAYKDLMGDLEEIEELEDQVRDAFLESIDAVGEAFDQQRESYEFIGDQIEHDIKMMELLYGDQAYGKMSAYFDKQIKNTKATLDAEQKAAAYWKQKAEAERAAIAAGGGDKEALAKYEENWKESVSNVNELLETWADQVTAKYENTIDEMIQSLNDKVSNGLGLEYLDEELSLLNENADNYLDSINAAYAVQNLSNKWQDAIDNTDSIEGQERLNELMQSQMKMLEEKGKLTQYDIDRAEKEYQIALKQIALQEAQQNKSKMRLKRDSNGNYSYQFVSDEDSIKDAERELADAKNDLYNFDKGAYQNNLNEMYSTWNEFQEKIAEAYKTYAGDQDALNEHIALLQAEYGEKINFLTEQNLSIRGNLTNSAFNDLADIYNTDVSNFENMTEAEKNLILNDLVPQWDSGVQQMIDKFAGEGGFEEVCQNTFDGLADAASKYLEELDNIKIKNQEASEEAYEQGNQILEQSNQLVDAAKEEYDRITEVLNQVNHLREAYLGAKEEAIKATKAAYDYVGAQNKIIDKQKEINDSGANFTPGGDNTPSGPRPSSNPGGYSGGNNGGSRTNPGVTPRPQNPPAGPQGPKGTGANVTLPAAGRVPSGVPAYGYGGQTATSNDGNTYQFNGASRTWDYKKKGASYDTGGYTGEWGAEGRLAFLHQKELVLNARDTANMFNALNVLRGIVGRVGEDALTKASTMLNGLGAVMSNPHADADALEQTVYITATFEGQTNADQIQTALDNLVNIAAQRASRTKR